MACFLIPAGEAIVTAAITKAVKTNNEKESIVEDNKIPFSKKLGWLTKMLAGGSVLLAFEHIWHGEVVPWFPFLTAASNAADTAEMLHEMSTVGVFMAVLITVVWIGMVAVSDIVVKRESMAATSK
ncbi:MAG: hypothetical protein LUG24_04540 [Clostridiales bacterium]|nr:hypothetical protein [Clostridiales bacterium]